jgi:hypothetical protein
LVRGRDGTAPHDAFTRRIHVVRVFREYGAIRITVSFRPRITHPSQQIVDRRLIGR